jgi:general secretion pathway protein I
MTEFKKAFSTSRRNFLTTTGFTLIEVVVALAILGVGLTVIIELFSGGLRLARTSEEYTKAMHYAQMKMEEIATQQDIEDGIKEGEFDNTFRWKVGVKKVDILPVEKTLEFKPPVELFQIRVNILWKSGSKERSASIESFKTVKPGTDEKKS